ncbi:MAG: hypothetical protein JSU72_17915, partial [Deltaproteobacteria bacterium]
REMARVATCAANIRTSAMGVTYYTMIYRDFYPRDMYWAEMSRPLIQKIATRTAHNDPDGIDQVVKYYICPSDPVRAFTNMEQIRVDGTTKLVKANYRVSFGINSFLTQRFVNVAAARKGTNYTLYNRRQRKSSDVKRPGEIVMLTEAGNDNLWRFEQLVWDFDEEEESVGPRLEVHHRTGNNFLYADMHIQYEKVLRNASIPQQGVPQFPWRWVPLSRLQDLSE